MSLYADYAHEFEHYEIPRGWTGTELEAADFLGFPSTLILPLIETFRSRGMPIMRDGRVNAYGLEVLRKHLRLTGR